MKINNGVCKKYYNNGNLFFKGEYLNGNRNGTGKEYYVDGKLFFDGEYINGNRWNGIGYKNNGLEEFEIINGRGFGIEYNDYNGELQYKGEYIYGQRNGKGKEYNDYNGELYFEGEYINGERNGKGKEYHDNVKLLFEGEYIN